jgi:hypothetical protein
MAIDDTHENGIDTQQNSGALGHQRRSFRLILAISIGIFVVAPCAIFGKPLTELIAYFLRTGSIIVCEEVTSTSPQQIESFAHVEFAPSTSNLTMYSPEGCTSSRRFYIRFQIDPNDFDIFVASTRVESIDPPAITPTVFALVPDDLGWHLDSVEFSLTGSSPNSLDYQQSIGIDTNNPSQYTVYLVVTSYD